MYEKHTDGRLIAELSDRELLNIMSGICNQIESARKVIEAGAQATDSMVGILNPEFSAASKREKAEGVLRFLDQSLKSYLVEAILRGIELTEFLQKAYGRSSRIQINSWNCSNADLLKSISHDASIPVIE